MGTSRTFWDADAVDFLPAWGMPGRPGDGLVEYPTDATRNVAPIPCHSHNDYMRRVPLFDALHFGCTGVEADVWLFEEELYVGHNKAALTKNRTLQNLYVNPLVQLLDHMNPTTDYTNSTAHGVFDMDPSQSLVLLVDIKTDGRKTFPYVYRQLETLRSKDYLTYWDGSEVHARAITVVGTGNTPWDMLAADKKHRDIFFDAPLERLRGDHEGVGLPKERSSDVQMLPDQGTVGPEIAAFGVFDSSTSYWASASFHHTVGSVWFGRLSYKQKDIVRGHISNAKKLGLKARYWDTPSWPIDLRNYVWAVLVEEGVDVLNVDDLRGAAVGSWKSRVPGLWK